MSNPRVSGEIKFLKSWRKLSGIFMLVALISALTVNTLVISDEYRQVKSKAEILSEKLELMNEKYESLLEENENLKKQNEEIIERINQLSVINDRLTRENRELTEDNIALQNSLKMAAAAGIKPQYYEEFKGISSRGAVDRGRYIGKFLGTAYTPSKEECGNNKGITNSGNPIIPGVSIAVDKKYWPFGTVFYIKGLGYAVAMDTGSAIKGKYRFDFSVFDKNFARALGSRYWDVYLVRMGKGKVEKDSIL